MPVTAKWYGLAGQGQFSQTAARRVSWLDDTIKVTLHTSTYTPNQDTHDFADDLTNEVANGNGYTTGGVTLGTKTLTYDSASNTVRLDAADASWTFTASKTMRYAVIWKDTGSAATSPLLGYVDFGADETSSGTFTLQWDATDGVLRAVVA
jgi:hypothetical protein